MLRSLGLVCCRPGIHAGIAEATSNGITSTVLFFPDGRRFNRQLRSYDRRWLIDFMPNKAMHSKGGPYTCAPASVPCVILCMSLLQFAHLRDVFGQVAAALLLHATGTTHSSSRRSCPACLLAAHFCRQPLFVTMQAQFDHGHASTIHHGGPREHRPVGNGRCTHHRHGMRPDLHHLYTALPPDLRVPSARQGAERHHCAERSQHSGRFAAAVDAARILRSGRQRRRVEFCACARDPARGASALLICSFRSCRVDEPFCCRHIACCMHVSQMKGRTD